MACAVRLRADCLILLTDVDGVRDASGNTLSHLGAEDIAALMQTGAVTGGMLAKLNAVQEALAQEVPRVYIANGHRDGVLERILAGVGEKTGTVLVSSLAAGKEP